MGYFFSVAFTLFLVIDSLGTLPSYLALIEDFDKKKQRLITIRELFFALILMIAFLFIGGLFLDLLGVTKTTVEISGGIILFLIASRMIFSHEEPQKSWRKGSHFIVPIATPLLAGPSYFATIMIFGESELSNYLVLVALVIAWFFSALVYFFGHSIYNTVRQRGLLACQRLMGLLIALIAVQMLLEGIKDLIASGI
ncbi:MAG: MarC family protein [Chlamydiales bacterium]|nr:MarC family protein [Chlamydiales bacterium]